MTVMLDVRALTVGYGGGSVLHGVDLTVRRGHIHAVVGPNGAGKTTLLHTIAGLLAPSGGSIRLADADITGKPPHVIARSGVGLVPQGRRIFPSLTVDQHIRLAERAGRRRRRPERFTRDRVLELLPRLGERRHHRGSELSGGEQQMLALARALLGNPDLLLLDEPTEGLAPAIADEIHALTRTLADAGVTLVVATPQAALLDGIADAALYVRSGRSAAPADGTDDTLASSLSG
jgi:branched-chain amino acid transport system ATP-binding protein